MEVTANGPRPRGKAKPHIGRPTMAPGEATVGAVSCRLTEREAKALDRLAKRLRITKAQAVRQAVLGALEAENLLPKPRRTP